MNIRKAVDKDFITATLRDILVAPVSALNGVSDADAEKLKSAFGIKTIQGLAENKFFKTA
jgi:hypothetical protein